MASPVYTVTLFAHQALEDTLPAEPDVGEVWVVRNITVYLRESVPGPGVRVRGPELAVFAKFGPTNVESITGDESLSWEGRVVIDASRSDALIVEAYNGPSDIVITGYRFLERRS